MVLKYNEYQIITLIVYNFSNISNQIFRSITFVQHFFFNPKAHRLIREHNKAGPTILLKVRHTLDAFLCGFDMSVFVGTIRVLQLLCVLAH